jgi:hypothetical protein
MLNAYFVDYLHVQKGLTVESGTFAVTIFGGGGLYHELNAVATHSLKARLVW